jgi:hypothetical protein
VLNIRKELPTGIETLPLLTNTLRIGPPSIGDSDETIAPTSLVLVKNEKAAMFITDEIKHIVKGCPIRAVPIHQGRNPIKQSKELEKVRNYIIFYSNVEGL